MCAIPRPEKTSIKLSAPNPNKAKLSYSYPKYFETIP